MTEPRERIRDHLTTYPGTHFNALARALDLAPGQVQYHLRKLRGEGEVVEERLYGRTHYYTPEFDTRERGAIAVLRRETARDVVFHLLEHEPSHPAAVADALDIARSTLEWHLAHLTEQGLVEKRRDERGHVTLVVVDRGESIRLLDEITPSLSERMLDRFSRLVDDLLPE